MIDLESPVWNAVKGGALVPKLLRETMEGNMDAWAELFNQVCHQFTLTPAAYITAPHLAQIAREGPPNVRALALGTIGAIAASREVGKEFAPLLHEEWAADYMAATREALHLAAEALGKTPIAREDARALLATVAALHGDANLAMHLFLQPGTAELECPSCGEPIVF